MSELIDPVKLAKAKQLLEEAANDALSKIKLPDGVSPEVMKRAVKSSLICCLPVPRNYRVALLTDEIPSTIQALLPIELTSEVLKR